MHAFLDVVQWVAFFSVGLLAGMYLERRLRERECERIHRALRREQRIAARRERVDALCRLAAPSLPAALRSEPPPHPKPRTGPDAVN
jgi:hypothetical protein